jgi:hypothetical protein
MSDSLHKPNKVPSEPVSRKGTPETSPWPTAQATPAADEDVPARFVAVQTDLISTLNAGKGFIKHALSDISVQLDDEEAKTRYLSLFLDAASYFAASSSPKTIGSYVGIVVKEPLYSQLFGSFQVNNENESSEADDEGITGGDRSDDGDPARVTNNAADTIDREGAGVKKPLVVEDQEGTENREVNGDVQASAENNNSDAEDQESTKDKEANAKDQIFSILGTWLGLSALFRTGAGKQSLRPILLVRDAHDMTAKERDLKITIGSLLDSSVFIPKRSDQKDLEIPAEVENADQVLKLVESTRIHKELLNTFTLRDYAHVEILWVNNISRHMILSDRNGRDELELFEFPQITQIKRPLEGTHQFSTYMKEVWKSYSLLFPINGPVRHNGNLSRLILQPKFCWCKSCKVRRAFEKHNKGCEYSTASLFKALNLNEDSWNTDDFPILWHRILKMRDHQAMARPATVKALWKDRRNPVQFYGIW